MRGRCVLAGLFQMDCVAEQKQEWIWYLLGPLLGVVALGLVVVWLVLTYRARLLQALETRHINALKRRLAKIGLSLLSAIWRPHQWCHTHYDICTSSQQFLTQPVLPLHHALAIKACCSQCLKTNHHQHTSTPITLQHEDLGRKRMYASCLPAVPACKHPSQHNQLIQLRPISDWESGQPSSDCEVTFPSSAMGECCVCHGV